LIVDCRSIPGVTDTPEQSGDGLGEGLGDGEGDGDGLGDGDGDGLGDGVGVGLSEGVGDGVVSDSSAINWPDVVPMAPAVAVFEPVLPAFFFT
jgi:hypothetical protein